MRTKKRGTLAVAAGAVLAGLLAGPAGATPPAPVTGPSTTTAPYVLPLADGVQLASLLTVDDAGSATNGYEFVGIPDGIGIRGPRNRATITVNHELNATAGIPRRHGQAGSFISELTVDLRTNEVTAGQDLIDPGVRFWDYLTSSYATAPNAAGTRADGATFPAYNAAFGRFCSGTGSDLGQFFNDTTGNGYNGRIRFGNEEVGDEGRVFGVLQDGRAQQLPRLGLFSWENTVAAHNQSDTTTVMGLEDAGTAQMWVYVGRKKATGNGFARAGLTDGLSYVLDITDELVTNDTQFRAAYGVGTPAAFDLAEVGWDQSGAAQNAEALAEGLTLNRIEDGAFDPNNPNDFYFVTTAGEKLSTASPTQSGGGLWRIRWNDVDQPALGGTLELLLDGSEGLTTPDNLEVDSQGNVLIQEDPGNNAYLARIFAYRIADGALAPVASFDPALFTPGQPGFITQDEESSGIVEIEDVTGIPGDFVFSVQVHAAPANNAAEYVERGQLVRMTVADWDAVYGPTPS